MANVEIGKPLSAGQLENIKRRVETQAKHSKRDFSHILKKIDARIEAAEAAKAQPVAPVAAPAKKK
jgi:hypothetical protein